MLLGEGAVSFTDPGCGSADHVEEIWEASFVWMAGERWPEPRRLSCGCQHWIGEAAEERVLARGGKL